MLGNASLVTPRRNRKFGGKGFLPLRVTDTGGPWCVRDISSHQVRRPRVSVGLSVLPPWVIGGQGASFLHHWRRGWDNACQGTLTHHLCHPAPPLHLAHGHTLNTTHPTTSDPTSEWLRTLGGAFQGLEMFIPKLRLQALQKERPQLWAEWAGLLASRPRLLKVVLSTAESPVATRRSKVLAWKGAQESAFLASPMGPRVLVPSQGFHVAILERSHWGGGSRGTPSLKCGPRLYSLQAGHRWPVARDARSFTRQRDFLKDSFLLLSFWLCWVFIAACALPLVAMSGG